MSDDRALAAGGAPPRWRLRFTSPVFGMPSWSVQRPDRVVYAANSTGRWQVHAHDLAGGVARGVAGGRPAHRCAIAPDGATVAWFDDDDRDEVGVWLAEPFAGGPTTPLLAGVEPAFSAGLALGPGGRVALGTASDAGFTLWLGHAGEPPRRSRAHEHWLHVEGMSADGMLTVCVHTAHGEALLPALRAVDSATGETVAELWDGPGNGLYAPVCSPVPGDTRVALVHDRHGIERPGLWDPRGGERVDLEVPLAGDVEEVGWWPDGASMLLTHSHRGRTELHRLDLATGACTALVRGEGSPGAARVRPDGAVWYRWSSGASPPSVRSTAGAATVLGPPPSGVPGGAPFVPWSFANPAGAEVHGYVVEPAAPRPHPMVMLVHGGPHQHDSDAWNPTVQAFVDHGWAVGLVNYRGSTGYGSAWASALRGDPGRPEVEDVVAGRDDLVARGVADPRRVMIAGGSWGGYVTLLAVGTRPDGWRAAIALAPIADWVTAFEEQSPEVRALARSLFGGDPGTHRALYVERSPITHVDRVVTPVLLLAAERDPRCPPRQLARFTERMRAAGKPLEVGSLGAGHSGHGVDERIEQVGRMLAFGAAHVPGTASPS